MNPNPLASMHGGVVGMIDPDAYAASTLVTGWIAGADFWLWMAIIQVGDIVATGLVDAKLEQATDSSGSGAKDITGKLITQLTAAGSDDDKQAIINLSPEELDVNAATPFTHFRLSVTLTTAGADMGAIVIGMAARFGPAQLRDLASVAEIIA